MIRGPLSPASFLAALVAAGATPSLALGVVAAAWVNPTLQPIRELVEVPAPTTIQLEVTRAGVIVHNGPPVAVGAGPAGLEWNGRGARADGLYAVQVRDLASGLLVGGPAPVRVDLHPPRMQLRGTSLTIPPAGGPPLSLTVSDVERGGVSVRARVETVTGPRVSRGWVPWAGPARAARLVGQIRALRGLGPRPVTIDARDDAGNVSRSDVAWVDPDAGRPGRLRVVRRVLTTRPWVALTFDDGYSAASIDSILTTLTRMRARATFCFNAVNARVWPPPLRRRIALAVTTGALGICSHGYSHRTTRSTSAAFDSSDIRANVAWDRIAGISSVPFYRPPGGDYGAVLSTSAQSLGYRYLVLWSLDTRDWSGVSSEQVRSDVVAGARAGDIVLEHAIPNSATALPRIISGLRARGLEPVRLADLLSAGSPSP